MVVKYGRDPVSYAVKDGCIGAGFCAVKSLQDIKAQDFILTPGRYVGIAEQEDDGEPFADKMQRLTSELSTLFAESHRLEDEIKKQLGSIGFEIA